MPRPYVRPSEELTAFARLIRDDYMWARKPNMSVAELAEKTGIHPQTIWDWINRGVKPKPVTLMALHRATGIPLKRLFEAAEIDVPWDAAWDRIVSLIRREDDLPEQAKEYAIASINEARERFDADPTVFEAATEQYEAAMRRPSEAVAAPSST